MGMRLCFLGQTNICSKRKLYESNNEQQVTTDEEYMEVLMKVTTNNKLQRMMDDEEMVHGSPANFKKRGEKRL